MIIWYEGLPRSGKSYSAVRDEIVPALQRGRSVWAYVEGLNVAAIAAYAKLEPVLCGELLHCLTREQVPDIHKLVGTDALVVIDEAQNFWPTRRGRLSDDMTQFIAEHGHKGLDIVLLGQSMKDIHPLWRRRIERKYYFLKKSAIGKPNSYSCTISTVVPNGDDVELQTVQTVSGVYDKAIFGLYSSHVGDVSNKETQVDERAVIWNTRLFRFWLPAFGVLFVVCSGFVWAFFHNGIKAPAAVAAAAAAPSVAVKPPVVAAAVPAAVEPLPRRVDFQEPGDVVEDLNTRGRARLLGFVRIGDRIQGLVEWRDSAMNLLHTMSFRDLGGLGWVVMVNPTGTIATMTRGPRVVTLLAWPIDQTRGRASETQLASVSGAHQVQSSEPVYPASVPLPGR